MSGTSQTIPSTGGSSTLPASSITMTADSILTNTDVESNLGIVNDSLNFYNGTFLEAFDAIPTESGGVVTLGLEKSGTGDLTMRFSDGETTLDCTPKAEIVLTLGSDATAQSNYIYILQSTKALTKSLTTYPSAEHIKIGFFLVPSATFVSTHGGSYVNQNINDGAMNGDKQGHLTHMGMKSRRGGATYFSGVDPNGTTNYLTITAGTVYYKATSGIIDQMHAHTAPAVDTSSGGVVLVTNWNGSNYNAISNLYDIVDDSTGTTIGNNQYFNFFVWGVANKGGTYDPTMINIPSGTYTTQANAEADVNHYDNTTIPREYILDSGTAYPICRITVQKTSTTWVYKSFVDLRIPVVSGVSGATGENQTSFSDNVFKVFNVSDATKIVDIDASSVTTGNTRTLAIPDKDITIADNADIINKTIGTTKGDLIGFSATSTPARLAVGANDTVLVADSTETTGLKWGSAGGGAFESLTPVILDCENTSSLIDLANISIPADTWANGEIIRIDMHLTTKQNSGGAINLTTYLYWGGQGLYQPSATSIPNSAVEGAFAMQIYLKRIGGIIWYSMLSHDNSTWVDTGIPAEISTDNYPIDDSLSPIGRRDFQSFDFTLEIKVRAKWGTANASAYIRTESASAYKTGGTV